MKKFEWGRLLPVLLGAGIAVGGVWFQKSGTPSAHRAGPSVPGDAEPARAPVVQTRLVSVQVNPTVTGPEKPSGDSTGASPQPKSFDETLFEIEQKFDAIPRASEVEHRNEQGLRTVFEHLDFAAGLAQGGLQCRGSSCRATLAFKDIEQAKAVLNAMPSDPEWKRRNFGFNALPEDPENPDSQRYVVYFTSSEPDTSN